MLPADVVSIVPPGVGPAAAALLDVTESLQARAREHGWPVRVCALSPAEVDAAAHARWGLPPDRLLDPGHVADLVRTAVTLPADVVLHRAVLVGRTEPPR
ncbi:hypothetical protein GCM10025868_31570 [Angustibacter aerolatus]|uniref:Uncharacterized protein n=1 Tax=Angustibacter aerolatus TaxID=1162965 RepID=A0ABQ6JJG7_9ACTN|nr:hypothetical protein [Angustibacter aerolatus]GMA87907.1 hypothetical protein GCM10025868_31570 [Angustibacter aerolatus]